MILKGFDSIEFVLYCEDYIKKLRPFLERFAELKKKAQEFNMEQEIELNGMTVKIHRSGIIYYSFTVSTADFIVWFKENNNLEHPPVKVRFLSGFLWSFGLAEAISRFFNWFSIFGISVDQLKLSRLDICADSDEVKFIESDKKGFITRAQMKDTIGVDNQHTQGKKFSGFVIGRGNPLLARIYDKTLEIKKSQKTWFYEVWKKEGWNENNTVWRVEFQLRSEVLKEYGLNSLDDILPLESNLWAALTKKWLTLRSPNNDKNVSRWPLKRKWKKIQSAFLSQEASPLVRNKVIEGDAERILNQINGLVLSLAAKKDHEDISETLTVLKNWTDGKLKLKQTTFSNEIELRKKRFIQSIKKTKESDKYGKTPRELSSCT